MPNTTLIVGAALLLALVFAANAKTPGALTPRTTVPPPPPANGGFSFLGAGLGQGTPGGAITTVNSGIVVANNALGFYNNLSSLWSSDDGSSDGSSSSYYPNDGNDY